MIKVRIWYFVKAKILKTSGFDMVDDSEVLTPADFYFHIDKMSAEPETLAKP
jgi:pyridoxal 5'-phosphate synthase pdxS subunit